MDLILRTGLEVIACRVIAIMDSKMAGVNKQVRSWISDILSIMVYSRDRMHNDEVARHRKLDFLGQFARNVT